MSQLQLACFTLERGYPYSQLQYGRMWRIRTKIPGVLDGNFPPTDWHGVVIVSGATASSLPQFLSRRGRIRAPVVKIITSCPVRPHLRGCITLLSLCSEEPHHFKPKFCPDSLYIVTLKDPPWDTSVSSDPQLPETFHLHTAEGFWPPLFKPYFTPQVGH